MLDRPRAYDVAVLGGGVVGCAIAYALARKKLAPVVLDSGGPGQDGAGAASASVWDHTEPVEVALRSLESAECFPSLQEQVGPFAYRRTGGLVPALTDAAAEAAEAFVRTRDEAGLPVRWLSRDEAVQREPALSPAVLGATYSPYEAVLNPVLLARRLASAARRLGAAFLFDAGHVAVHEQAGRYSVRSGHGVLEVRRLVMASGRWLADAGQQLGVRMPTRPVRGCVAVTERLPTLVRHRLPGVRQHPAGEVVLDATGGDDEPGVETLRVIGDTISAAVRMIPALVDAHVIRTSPWRAVVSADGRPLLGHVEDGLYVAVPHTAGVTLAPLFAQAIASMLSEARSPEAVEAWNPLRTARLAGATSGRPGRKDSSKGP